MATSRSDERILVSLGQGTTASVQFEESQALSSAGVLFLLPALLAQGLLKTKEIYQWSSKFYYGIESIILTLAFMALMRIKNPEQLKQCKPGEIGRIIGLDRIPETRCLREKFKHLTDQQQSSKLSNLLVDDWYKDDNSEYADFLYIDGHNRIYYGDKASLPKKFVSRQKLCLSATTEYWVNDALGMPVMMVMGELNEKLQESIEHYIIPELKKTQLLNPQNNSPETPVCTFVFDREAYEPSFFYRLWKEHKIAVITYRKNVKDTWPVDGFKSQSVSVLQQTIIMQLCEKKTQLGGYEFREIRRRSEHGHQTAIITTHPSISTPVVAGRMFARWSQENYFKYLIADYDFDKMISFGVETIDDQKEVVNPEYRILTHQIKIIREKIQRIEAKFFSLIDQAIDKPIESLLEISDKQMEQKNAIEQYRTKEKELLEKRATVKPRITLKEMPEEKRYNKLKTESKMLMNVLRMICYRAESSVASWIAPYLKNADNEKRMLVKQIIASNADVIPDYQNQTLTITLHSLSTNRYNNAANELTKILNDTQTMFPGTDLRMIFKISANSICEG